MLGDDAFAQTYPSQDIHFIVGFAPGSGPDLITRWIAEKIRPHLDNRTILVENKVGAGGNIATEYVARSKPDGYVIYVTGGSALAASGHLFKHPPVDVTKAFESIATLARQPTLVVVGPNSPYKSVTELQAGMKSDGDKASYVRPSRQRACSAQCYAIRQVARPWRSSTGPRQTGSTTS